MRPPKDTYYGDSWFILKSQLLPPWSNIRHMASAGNIELTFQDTDYQTCNGLEELLESDMELIKTGKYLQHVTLRLHVPKIVAFNDFQGRQEDVETTLVGAERLLRLFQQHQIEFEKILIPARAKEKMARKVP
jgi:hypothetical protein